jgi:hypothetical protein
MEIWPEYYSFVVVLTASSRVSASWWRAALDWSESMTLLHERDVVDSTPVLTARDSCREWASHPQVGALSVAECG